MGVEFSRDEIDNWHLDREEYLGPIEAQFRYLLKAQDQAEAAKSVADRKVAQLQAKTDADVAAVQKEFEERAKATTSEEEQQALKAEYEQQQAEMRAKFDVESKAIRDEFEAGIAEAEATMHDSEQEVTIDGPRAVEKVLSEVFKMNDAAEVAPKLLAKFDVNSDGRLSRQEYLFMFNQALDEVEKAIRAMQYEAADSAECRATWGLRCCICTLGLSCVPFCCGMMCHYCCNSIDTIEEIAKGIRVVASNEHPDPTPQEIHGDDVQADGQHTNTVEPGGPENTQIEHQLATTKEPEIKQSDDPAVIEARA